jgi:RNA polymerase sigma-70 factor (ECF subfamily)
MKAIASGDDNAAKLVVEQHLPSVLALARHMLGSEEEAEDVAQEAFMRLWKQADKWEPGRALIITWLRRVASNQCIDRIRRNRTVPLSPTDEFPVAAVQQHDMEEQQLQARVSAALQELPERQRLALGLCHFQGLSQAEAANEMDISEHALESLLARARRGLKQKLEKEWQGLLPDSSDLGAFERENG